MLQAKARTAGPAHQTDSRVRDLVPNNLRTSTKLPVLYLFTYSGEPRSGLKFVLQSVELFT